nr:MAG: hypothetical protein DIU78_16770 [Pseudomonadota bacterium]
MSFRQSTRTTSRFSRASASCRRTVAAARSIPGRYPFASASICEGVNAGSAGAAGAGAGAASGAGAGAAGCAVATPAKATKATDPIRARISSLAGM